MSLSELVLYFNDHFHQYSATGIYPSTRFAIDGDQCIAFVGNQIFSNHFTRLHQVNTAHTFGYESSLQVKTALGNAISVDSVFSALEDLSNVVYLDRVTRTLQCLNYLQLPHTPAQVLSLAVQQRHILGVTSHHGRTFEAILSDCGLATTNILLHTQLPAPDLLHHFHKAFTSYRSWGFSIGIQIHTDEDWQRLDQWYLEPDYLLIFDAARSEDQSRLDHWRQRTQCILASTNPDSLENSEREKYAIYFQ